MINNIFQLCFFNQLKKFEIRHIVENNKLQIIEVENNKFIYYYIDGKFEIIFRIHWVKNYSNNNNNCNNIIIKQYKHNTDKYNALY